MGSNIFSLLIQGGAASALFSIFINEVITKDFGYTPAFFIYGGFTCVTIVLTLLLKEHYDWRTYLSESTRNIMKTFEQGPIKETEEEMITE